MKVTELSISALVIVRKRTFMTDNTDSQSVLNVCSVDDVCETDSPPSSIERKRLFEYLKMSIEL